MIPQCSPSADYLAHKSEIDTAVSRVLESGWYVLGNECQQFEHEFATFNQMPFAVGVANGTDAVEIALRGVGVSQGDKVITVSHTAVATVAAIRRMGANPLFVDIKTDYTMDADSLQQVIRETNDTIAAIVVVHLYGQPADMRAIMDIANANDIKVIEDCAQAHGAAIDDLPVGSFGSAACYSFYPTKNLGAIGDGGMIVCDDESLFQQFRLLRQYGWNDRVNSELQGFNSRLDEIQAAILRVKLEHLPAANESRREIADYYSQHLADLPLELPMVKDGIQHAFHQFVIRCSARNHLKSDLARSSIGTAIHYLKPVHLQTAWMNPDYCPVPLPRTEQTCQQILSLPMYPQLTDVEQDKVCEAIRSSIG
jgi:dTDP-4-amino-4,6-dideoxygalactose transaminase